MRQKAMLKIDWRGLLARFGVSTAPSCKRSYRIKPFEQLLIVILALCTAYLAVAMLEGRLTW